MRLLLHECVPVQVRNALPGHEVLTAQQMGWAGFKNGVFLSAAESGGFDLLILADKNLRCQQNLAGRRLAILELWTNHRPTLERYFPEIRCAAEAPEPSEYRRLQKPE